MPLYNTNHSLLLGTADRLWKIVTNLQKTAEIWGSRKKFREKSKKFGANREKFRGRTGEIWRKNGRKFVKFFNFNSREQHIVSYSRKIFNPRFVLAKFFSVYDIQSLHTNTQIRTHAPPADRLLYWNVTSVNNIGSIHIRL